MSGSLKLFHFCIIYHQTTVAIKLVRQRIAQGEWTRFLIGLLVSCKDSKAYLIFALAAVLFELTSTVDVILVIALVTVIFPVGWTARVVTFGAKAATGMLALGRDFVTVGANVDRATFSEGNTCGGVACLDVSSSGGREETIQEETRVSAEFDCATMPMMILSCST